MDDFDRRRELRRQKREEMRLEAERIAYQRNDDDEEEAARERRRRARQERLRQKQEEESLGQVTDQVEVNAQNSVSAEEAKTSAPNPQGEGDEEAALLERLARREERRQKRLQEALERQKEFDPTITDAGGSLPSRMENNTAENEAAEKEEKSESRQESYEIEEVQIITKAYQKNDWRDAAGENKKEEKEEGEEEKPKQGSVDDHQVEVMVEERREGTAEAVGTPLKNGHLSAEESTPEEGRDQESEEGAHQEKVEAIERERAEAERAELEAEERERLQAEQERKMAEERARVEAEAQAAREREQREREERERAEEEEKRAEERRRAQAEEEEKRAEERRRAQAEEEERAKREEQRHRQQLEANRNEAQERRSQGERVPEQLAGKRVPEKKVPEEKAQPAHPKKQGEDKGTKVQLKREKSQEDKATFKKEEVTVTVKLSGPRVAAHYIVQADGLKVGIPKPRVFQTVTRDPPNGETKVEDLKIHSKFRSGILVSVLENTAAPSWPEALLWDGNQVVVGHGQTSLKNPGLILLFLGFPLFWVLCFSA